MTPPGGSWPARRRRGRRRQRAAVALRFQSAPTRRPACAPQCAHCPALQVPSLLPGPGLTQARRQECKRDFRQHGCAVVAHRRQVARQLQAVGAVPQRRHVLDDGLRNQAHGVGGQRGEGGAGGRRCAGGRGAGGGGQRRRWRPFSGRHAGGGAGVRVAACLGAPGAAQRHEGAEARSERRRAVLRALKRSWDRSQDVSGTTLRREGGLGPSQPRRRQAGAAAAARRRRQRSRRLWQSPESIRDSSECGSRPAAQASTSTEPLPNLLPLAAELPVIVQCCRCLRHNAARQAASHPNYQAARQVPGARRGALVPTAAAGGRGVRQPSEGEAMGHGRPAGQTTACGLEVQRLVGQTGPT